jgi:hypothetical protein
MEELYIVKDVCENPSQTNFLKLTDRTKKFFNKASRICVKKSFGNVEFAKKIISVFLLTTLDKNNIYEINSLLKSINFINDNSKIIIFMENDIFVIRKYKKYFIFSKESNNVKIKFQDMNFFMFEFFKRKKISKIDFSNEKRIEFFNNKYGINYKNIVKHVLNNIYSKFRNDNFDIEKLVEYRGKKIKLYNQIYYTIGDMLLDGIDILDYIKKDIENEKHSIYLKNNCIKKLWVFRDEEKILVSENKADKFYRIYTIKTKKYSINFTSLIQDIINQVKKCEILTIFFIVKKNEESHSMVLMLNYSKNDLIMYLYDPNGGNNIFYEELYFFSNEIKKHFEYDNSDNNRAMIYSENICKRIHFLPKDYDGKGYCLIYGLFFIYCVFSILQKIDMDLLKLIQLIQHNILIECPLNEELFFKMMVNFSFYIKNSYLKTV